MRSAGRRFLVASSHRSSSGHVAQPCSHLRPKYFQLSPLGAVPLRALQAQELLSLYKLPAKKNLRRAPGISIPTPCHGTRHATTLESTFRSASVLWRFLPLPIIPQGSPIVRDCAPTVPGFRARRPFRHAIGGIATHPCRSSFIAQRPRARP